MKTGSAAAGMAARFAWLAILAGAMACAQASSLTKSSGERLNDSGPDTGQAAAKTSEVLVRVNGLDVTVDDLDAVERAQERWLAQQAQDSTRSSPAERKSRAVLLQEYIDDVLQTQKGFQLGLKPDPNGPSVLERYRKRVVADVKPPGEADISAYFDSHPVLFAQRRIYHFKEVTADVPQGEREEVKARIQRVKAYPELEKLLSGRGRLGPASSVRRAAEQLPLASLDRFHAMRVGDAIVAERPGGLSVLFLEREESSPVSYEQSVPMIRAFLTNERLRAALDEDKRALRAAARIEYVVPETSSPPAAASDEGPAVARVNGEPIGRARVYLLVDLLRQADAGKTAQASRTPQAPVDPRAALQRLIDQKLVLLDARARGQQVEAPADLVPYERDRRAAESYWSKLLAEVKDPSERDIRKYFDTHPALFTKRRIYAFEELTIDVPAAQQPELLAALRLCKTSREMKKLLSERLHTYQVRDVVRAAEQLPLDKLDTFQAMKAGQLTVSRQGDIVTATLLAAVEERPVTLDKARAAITAFLGNERKRAIVEARRKDLRAAAKVEYLDPELAPLP